MDKPARKSAKTLTDKAVISAKAGEKPLKLYDERGLFLLVTPAGGKWWRLKYRIDGKEKLLSLGVYPDVGLKDARERRDAARKLLADGIDPGVNRKATKALREVQVANSFETVSREWYEKQAPAWVPAHGDRIIRRLERDIFPHIGKRPISEITAPQLLEVVRRIEMRGALETAHRAMSNCGQVFRYAVATGRATRDPSGDLRGALPPVRGEHFAAVTEPQQVGAILRSLDAYQGTATVSCALRLAPLVFVRPGELRAAEWAHIDLDAAEWRYIVTKTDTPHIVPLATQAVAILREIQLLTGHGRYVFPSARTGARPMSDNAILAAMRRMGIGKDEMSGHGFRAMARTILDEVLGQRVDLIEHQLAHAVKDPNGRAYNRTAHLPERRKMMQQWADYLDKLRATSNP
ncbi:tyrosine-type recombinase/integrase [Massilia pseudoviolaceinigra]|uniref:tyrosine-type recombinase/integrase n=1 Tax=Massilia pseudoviolaceinigra TaxID=3057165 RepID=UPI002796A999|nr:integrase arm-type DNA-binding domain-containing protein [Massilia sp. CCM 9206]MDQ1919402.1 integrase arm-type DNA-binding domain-containing protein [Massilia sp. CCM 9206]